MTVQDVMGRVGGMQEEVTGSRSVTTRIVKRGGMEMEGMVKGEVEDGAHTAM